MNDNNEQSEYAHEHVRHLHSKEFKIEKKQNQGFFQN
jgi:hypothetical protein